MKLQEHYFFGARKKKNKETKKQKQKVYMTPENHGYIYYMYYTYSHRIDFHSESRSKDIIRIIITMTIMILIIFCSDRFSSVLFKKHYYNDHSSLGAARHEYLDMHMTHRGLCFLASTNFAINEEKFSLVYFFKFM